PDPRRPRLQCRPLRVRERHHHGSLPEDHAERVRPDRRRRADRPGSARQHEPPPVPRPGGAVGSEPEERVPPPVPAPLFHRSGVLSVGRALRIALAVVAGVLLGLAIIAVSVYVLTETRFGAERVRSFVVSRIEQRIQGAVRVERIRPGGLLGGAIIEDFVLEGPGGRPFLRADSARIRYDLGSLLAGRWIFRDVVLFSPVGVIERLPGDTAWNYQYTFEDPTPDDDGPDPFILIENARIVDGTITVRW